MDDVICGLAVVQVMVLFLYFYRKCLVLERKRILARNVDWSLENEAFVDRFLNPSYAPFVLSTFITIVGVLLTRVFVRQELFVWGYIGSLLVGLGIGAICHLPSDFQACKRIPPSQVRRASLSPRTLSTFFPAKLHKTAHILVGLVFAGDIAFYLLNVISGARVFAILILHIVIFGLAYGMLVRYLRERSIHRLSIARLSDKDIDAHYKQASIGITVGCIYLLIIFSAIEFVSWTFGYELWEPYMKMMLSLMKSPDAMLSLFSKNGLKVCSAVAFLFTLVLLFWLPRSDAYRDLENLSFRRVP